MKSCLLLASGVFASLWIFTIGYGTNMRNYGNYGANLYATNVGNNRFNGAQTFAQSTTNMGINRFNGAQTYGQSGINMRHNGYYGMYGRSMTTAVNTGLDGTYGMNENMGRNIAPAPERDYECGLRIIKEVTGRIIGGKLAKYGEFPFVVSIRMGTKTQNQHHCGGALIGRSWILTAAHCFVGFSPRQFTVRVGEFNLDDTNEFEMDHFVDRIVFHSQLYQPKRFNNDIALLKLTVPVKYNDHVMPTCLPQATDDFTGVMGTIMGWGALQEKSDDPSSALQKVKVRIMNRTECQMLYDMSRKKITFYPGQICAGYKEGKLDACQGDSGGPLVLEENNRYTVVGIVSAGIGCGRALLPGVYTEVAAKLGWINEIMSTV